jgi:glutamine amidotransferase-like uncharacterized protein
MLSTSGVKANTDLTEIHVGLYDIDAGQSVSVVALEKMFEWMGSTVISLNGEAIRNGTLDMLDLVVFPAGTTNGYTLDLEDEGIELVRQFVANGGSIFSFCGAARFVSDVLRICEGTWSRDIPGMPGGAALVEFSVNTASTGPNLSDEPESYQVYYSKSSYFIPNNPYTIIPIMYYPTNNGVAMFVARYGAGTLFSSGIHAEYEEGSDRDGDTAYDFLTDPDSEWDILQKVTEWLIDESSGTPNLNPFGALNVILTVFGVSTVIIIVGIILFYIRRR